LVVAVAGEAGRVEVVLPRLAKLRRWWLLLVEDGV
jgi:hypothetical protein